jgi:hypothetical protein
LKLHQDQNVSSENVIKLGFWKVLNMSSIKPNERNRLFYEDGTFTGKTAIYSLFHNYDKVIHSF